MSNTKELVWNKIKRFAPYVLILTSLLLLIFLIIFNKPVLTIDHFKDQDGVVVPITIFQFYKLLYAFISLLMFGQPYDYGDRSNPNIPQSIHFLDTEMIVVSAAILILSIIMLFKKKREFFLVMIIMITTFLNIAIVNMIVYKSVNPAVLVLLILLTLNIPFCVIFAIDNWNNMMKTRSISIPLIVIGSLFIICCVLLGVFYLLVFVTTINGLSGDEPEYVFGFERIIGASLVLKMRIPSISTLIIIQLPALLIIRAKKRV